MAGQRSRSCRLPVRAAAARLRRGSLRPRVSSAVRLCSIIASIASPWASRLERAAATASAARAWLRRPRWSFRRSHRPCCAAGSCAAAFDPGRDGRQAAGRLRRPLRRPRGRALRAPKAGLRTAPASPSAVRPASFIASATARACSSARGRSFSRTPISTRAAVGGIFQLLRLAIERGGFLGQIMGDSAEPVGGFVAERHQLGRFARQPGIIFLEPPGDDGQNAFQRRGLALHFGDRLTETLGLAHRASAEYQPEDADQDQRTRDQPDRANNGRADWAPWSARRSRSKRPARQAASRAASHPTQCRPAAGLGRIVPFGCGWLRSAGPIQSS